MISSVERKADLAPARYAPITDPDITACGLPEEYDASKEFKGKKVVIVSVPGAFTPGCQARHIPPYLENINKIAEKGVDLVVVIASNDSWVMAAWGKANGVTGDSKVKFMSDSKTFFSKQIGWMAGSKYTAKTLFTRRETNADIELALLVGDRNGRWAMIVEKDGTISYAEIDAPRQVEVSSDSDSKSFTPLTDCARCPELKLFFLTCR